ncbi:DUF2752 domain-containing protein [Streptomyces sp. NPDC059740]|uniref:DUF2752 domain-containing protein n=1 Tax=Streptomyces sp. NPDC059740 TaxID=3346926 RepID=UPI003657CA7B
MSRQQPRITRPGESPPGFPPPAPPRPGGPPPGRPAPSPAPRSRARRLAAPLGALAAAAVPLAWVGVVDPHVPGRYPPCLLLRLTGLYCPGCGGLRATHDLLHGHLTGALRDNAPAVALYALLAVGWAVWTAAAAAGAGRVLPPRLRPRPVHAWVLGVLLLVFSVLRNLPAGSFLRP